MGPVTLPPAVILIQLFHTFRAFGMQSVDLEGRCHLKIGSHKYKGCTLTIHHWASVVTEYGFKEK